MTKFVREYHNWMIYYSTRYIHVYTVLNYDAGVHMRGGGLSTAPQHSSWVVTCVSLLR